MAVMMDTSVRWQDCFGPEMVEAVSHMTYAQRYGIIPFLEWLIQAEPESLANRVRRCFAGAPGEDVESLFPDGMSHERAFVDVLNQWRDAYRVSGESHLTEGTRMHRAHSVRHALEILRDRGVRGVPENFNRKWIRVGTPPTKEFPSLGAADCPELEGYEGYERERRAMELVRLSFVSLFLYYEELFNLGQSLIRGDPPMPDQDPQARETLRNGLLIFRDHIRETGSFKLPRRVAEYVLPRDPALWSQAGHFDTAGLWDQVAVMNMAYRGCFGPLAPAMIGALGVLICDTGWNIQPARDLARDPFVFRSAEGSYVAAPSFIESFKRRAGHHVLAFLGENHQLDEGRLRAALDHWDRTIEAYDPARQLDGYACLEAAGDGSALSAADVLDRYTRMANALRAEFGHFSHDLFGDRFWIFINGNVQPRTYASGTRAIQADVYPKNSVLARPGFNFKAIRKTFLIIRRQETGSIDAVRVAAGHASSSVLMPHYLNTPVVNAELDASIRQFQDAMEAIVVRDLNQEHVALQLDRPAADLARLRRTAERAGITAALGLLDEVPDDAGPAPPALRFEPDDERLGELYLIHRKLREMQAYYPNRARFRLEFLPLLALAKATGRELFRKHLGPRYWQAARRASLALRSQQIVLPSLED